MATQMTEDTIFGADDDLDVNRYWTRLAAHTVGEYGVRHSDAVAESEVVMYDDREDVGQREPGIRLQFRHNGPIRRRDGERRRRVVAFRLTDPAALDDLIADLQVARERLR